MRKRLLLKYLKKKVLLGSISKPRETERLAIKVIGEGTLKDAEASGSGQTLCIVSFIEFLPSQGNTELLLF